jgi:mRNA interferase MazF
MDGGGEGMKRGEIYYIERYRSEETGSEQHAGRPAIIVSNDKNNEFSETVEVVYLTTQPKNDLPTHVEIRSTTRASVALCEQVTTVSLSRIGGYVGTCTDQEMRMIETAIAISLGLDLSDPMPKKLEMSGPALDVATEIIRLQAERDIYKDLCEQLIEKLG